MSKPQITDSDIVDVLLGQASPEVERAVQTADREDVTSPRDGEAT